MCRGTSIIASCVFPAIALGSTLSVEPVTPARLFPLSAVRLLPGPFADAAHANRKYLLAHDADRLLAPFLREAGLPARKEPYPNWESMGLDGHTAGHYLSALAQMIAAGHDADGELAKRLNYMLAELERVQSANQNGYIGGVPGSKELWNKIAAGDVGAIYQKWVPWYNVHKTFAGLRDAYVLAERSNARQLLVKLGDWCVELTSKLSDAQMQQMLGNEHGGMNEVLADLYTITGDTKYLNAAKRFNHRAVIDPLTKGEDRLTGLHANTQIPKIIGLEQIAALTGDKKEHSGAEFFWSNVTQNRSVAFGGNSVSEHFNDVKDFSGVLAHREGPETCNTYNMLRLTEKLFSATPDAGYADFYERALYNHILSSIDAENPGYVYFTPLRPQHYRVYSVPEQSFWCCVGTGMENPGRYGQFIYAHHEDGGIHVNLFIPSVLKASEELAIEQKTTFPFEPRTHLTLKLQRPQTFALRIRHPAWVPDGQLAIRVNGDRAVIESKSSSYAEIRRAWSDGDTVEVELPMHIGIALLPDRSSWVAICYGPIVLAAATGNNDMPGVRAGPGRMAHVAHGPMVPLEQVPCLLTTADELLAHVLPDPASGPLHFRITDVVHPGTPGGTLIQPFFALRDVRYQMYWELTTAQELEQRKERRAAEERARAEREAATVDFVRPGEQQSEVEHDYKGEAAETGIHNGRRWRHGRVIQYAFSAGDTKAIELSVTYSGDDSGRVFDILVNDTLVATQSLTAEKRGGFIEKRYEIPRQLVPEDGRLTVRFVAKQWLAGGVYDVRLIRAKSAPVE